MLATGGSADYAIQEIKKLGLKSVSFCCIVAAPERVRKLNEKRPEARIFGVEMDGVLNEKKYIVPGLGDFGGRWHETE
jgi:uracil phosphoribosyltransferase